MALYRGVLTFQHLDQTSMSRRGLAGIEDRGMHGRLYTMYTICHAFVPLEYAHPVLVCHKVTRISSSFLIKKNPRH
jgi:hypothetical protein